MNGTNLHRSHQSQLKMIKSETQSDCLRHGDRSGNAQFRRAQDFEKCSGRGLSLQASIEAKPIANNFSSIFSAGVFEVASTTKAAALKALRQCLNALKPRPVNRIWLAYRNADQAWLIIEESGKKRIRGVLRVHFWTRRISKKQCPIGYANYLSPLPAWKKNWNCGTNWTPN